MALGKAVPYIWWKDCHHQIVPFIPSYGGGPVNTQHKTIYILISLKKIKEILKNIFFLNSNIIYFLIIKYKKNKYIYNNIIYNQILLNIFIYK